MLQRSANGFGAVALSSLLAGDARAGTSGLHHPAKAKSVIFLYMDGGPSHIDTFDPKPMLTKYHGQDPTRAIGKLEPTQFANVGKVLGSPWKFKQHCQSGIPVSELFPHVAKCVDDIAVVRSMVSKFPEHTSANYFLHTGSGLQGRPSWGAWLGYGLGTVNKNLPAFVVLNGGLVPPGGLDNFNSGFLPASFQGSVFNAGPMPVANIKPREKSDADQRKKLALIHELDTLKQGTDPAHDAIETAISNYQTAYQMQTAIPDLMSIERESAATQTLYGLKSEDKNTVTFGKQCLIARRLVERGVRFIELTCPSIPGFDRWDQHQDLVKGHERNALAVDQPIGGLLTDLKSRGLLDSTLVVWSGEFGRTPFAQGNNGRDHNPFAFTTWLAGGGIKGGTIHGESDEWGYKVVAGQNRNPRSSCHNVASARH